MPDWFIDHADENEAPLVAVTNADLGDWLAGQPPAVAAWVGNSGFEGKPLTHCLVPGDAGKLSCILFGFDADQVLWSWAGLPAALPAGTYRIASETNAKMETPDIELAALGWAIGCYRFARYKAEKGSEFPQMVWPDSCNRGRVERLAEAIFLVRDLINTPANEMGPAELADAVEKIAKRNGAKVNQIVGDDLLDHGYPAIHAVGKGSPRAPRLLDLTWGEKGAPLVTLVGKGVCFDTGGLDIKPAAAMKLMKKDMGGAAHALGLASAIMGAQMPVRLRLLIPAVENSVSGEAIRPQDVI